MSEEKEKSDSDLENFDKKIEKLLIKFSNQANQMEKKQENSQNQNQKSADILLGEFNYKPRDIKSHLDRFVIRQDEAKKALAIAVCDHYNHAKYISALEKQNPKEAKEIERQKQNVIVVGPTGVGKTYIVKHVAELLGVPFVKADATKFSETGYVGADVDDLVRELVQKAGGNVDLAEYGIIFIDEVDKIATRGGMIGRDVSGRGVQTSLLKLMEETEVSLHNPMDIKGQMQAMSEMQSGKKQKDKISTRHILFIVSGAFSGLEEVINKRIGKGEIGFSATLKNKQSLDEELFRYVTTQDFIEYGFEAEFVGRLPVKVVCEHLNAKDLCNIMNFSEGSILRQYEREFEAYGIHARFDESAIQMIAELAEKENTGARALMTVCENLLRDFKFELPGTSLSELKIDSDLIKNRDEVLNKYRELGKKVDIAKVKKEADLFCGDFYQKHGIEIEFSKEAIDLLSDFSHSQGRSVLQVCSSYLKDIHFGMKLTKQKKFILPAQVFEDPEKYLSEQIVEFYKK